MDVTIGEMLAIQWSNILEDINKGKGFKCMSSKEEARNTLGRQNKYFSVAVSAARTRGHRETVCGQNVQTDLVNPHDLMEKQHRKYKNFLKMGLREPLYSLANRELLEKRMSLRHHSFQYKHSGPTLNSLRKDY